MFVYLMVFNFQPLPLPPKKNPVFILIVAY